MEVYLDYAAASLNLILNGKKYPPFARSVVMRIRVSGARDDARTVMRKFLIVQIGTLYLQNAQDVNKKIRTVKIL